MRFAFVMDPLDRIDIDKDTTFAFMLAAQERGHELLVLHARDLAYGGHDVGATGRMAPVKLRRQRGDHYTLSQRGWVPLRQVDAVFMRSDPPFDLDYFMATQLLERARGSTLLINDPRGLREANEKLYALNFPEWSPPTIVTCDRQRIRDFVDEQGGEAIVKPLEGCAGLGIFHLKKGDRNLHSILESSTVDGKRYVMVQRYIPEVRQGDKRIILLDGEPLGAVLRVPKDDETRSNIHVGSSVQKTTLTDRERQICAGLKDRLRKDGLYFVGLDVIGGYLTEVNVTSPTGVQEVDRFDGVNLGARVIEWTEARVAGRAH
jgi:glutathione synthase